MNGRFLLDTNIVIALLAEESVILQHLKKSIEVFVASIVLGELYFGAQKSQKKEKNVEIINEFANECTVLFCDDSTAWYYGQIKNQLKIIRKANT